MIFKPASIVDTFVDFVLSSLRFYYPLSISDSDISANGEDRGYFETFADTEKYLNHIVMQIMKLSTFATHIILPFQTQHPIFKIARTNTLLYSKYTEH